MQIDDTAFYCSQLIEAACQVYSHASQIIDSG